MKIMLLNCETAHLTVAFISNLELCFNRTKKLFHVTIYKLARIWPI